MGAMSADGRPPYFLPAAHGGRWTSVRLALSMTASLLLVACVGVVSPLLAEVQMRYFRLHTDCLSSTGSETACASQASAAQGITQSLSSLGVLLLAPYYGNCSDQHGRRPFFCAGLVAAVLPFLAVGLYREDVRPFYVLQALSGFAPSPQAVFFTILADTIAPDARLQFFGLGAACFLAAFSAGAGISAVLQPVLGPGGLLPPAACAAAIAAAAAGALVPETLPEEQEEELPKVVRHQSLARIVVTPTSGANEQLLHSIAVIGLLSLLPEAGCPTIALFYAQARLRLTGEEVSSLGARMLCILGVGGFLWQSLGLAALRRVCPSTLWVYQVVLLANLLHLLGYMVMWAPWVFLANAALAGGPLAQPTILRGLVSQALPAGVQGYASGMLSGVEAAVRVAGPALFSGLFLAGGQVGLPGLPFGVGAGLVVAGSLLAALRLERHLAPPAKDGCQPLLAA